MAQVTTPDVATATGSQLQVEEQPSPDRVLASSHCSRPQHTMPSPQVAEVHPGVQGSGRHAEARHAPIRSMNRRQISPVEHVNGVSQLALSAPPARQVPVVSQYRPAPHVTSGEQTPVASQSATIPPAKI